MVQLRKASAVLSLTAFCQAYNIILTNDDGWAVASIRATFDNLVDAGYQVILSAPARNKSGSGSSSTTPKRLDDDGFGCEIVSEPCDSDGCQFQSCPPYSPPQGVDPEDPRLNYVNAFPVDSVRYGIKTLSHTYWGRNPDFVVSGPNVGRNYGKVVTRSGTVGAACEAALEGVPSTAFSGASGKQVSYTEIFENPHSQATYAAKIYAELVAIYTNALLSSAARPILPPGVTVNVNFSPISDCDSASDYQFVMSRNHAALGVTDVNTCGSTRLPSEETVAHTPGCFASVSVMNATTKGDVDASNQAHVLNRLQSILTCLLGK